MTATTYTNVPGAKPGASFGGWLHRAYMRLVEAREKQARRRIAEHFRGFDDEYLEKLGYSRADMARIRRG